MKIMNPQAYLEETKSTLIASPIVKTFVILEEYALSDRGYFRARLTLKNNDFLEVAEYFVVEKHHCITKRYRYQWMDESQQVLKKRWDNVKHFPDLLHFPHHVHIGEGSRVEASRAFSIVELIVMLSTELDK